MKTGFCKYKTQGVECANEVTDAAYFTSMKEFGMEMCWGHIHQAEVSEASHKRDFRTL